MAKRIAFYGPLEVYVRREAGEWAAFVDPFSIAGEGSSQSKAVESAMQNLQVLLDETARLIHRHGRSRVGVTCPLPRQEKKGKKLEGFIVAISKLTDKRRHRRGFIGDPQIHPIPSKSWEKAIGEAESFQVAGAI